VLSCFRGYQVYVSPAGSLTDTGINRDEAEEK
jgi:hypothetical protein